MAHCELSFPSVTEKPDDEALSEVKFSSFDDDKDISGTSSKGSPKAKGSFRLNMPKLKLPSSSKATGSFGFKLPKLKLPRKQKVEVDIPDADIEAPDLYAKGPDADGNFKMPTANRPQAGADADLKLSLPKFKGSKLPKFKLPSLMG
ncbi:neuroblast differentiation-associated protein AHNAK-like [Watersipora subatra]|uniref:neuroblast differentiation-associated protein AHNAK-like n=1 Tax=Watersipora subatra TaxID=2589382 RepID=UPI00355BFD57